MGEIIDAALRRQRIGIVVAVALGVLSGIAAVGIRGVGGPLVLLNLLPLVLTFAASVRYLRRPPSRQVWRLDERERAFYAPPRNDAGYPLVMIGFFAYGAVQNWGRAEGASWLVALAIFFALGTVALAGIFWQRVPGVELTPEGITHRRHERQWFVPWAALDPTGRITAPRRTWGIRLPVGRPELIANGGGWGRGRQAIAMHDVDVVPQLLAATIRHYLARPEERATIGTTEGYARLRHALDGGR
ncbi:hypothetical protein [Micromonospora purpureochromogenes]|uniref:PH domain-containing protein n=1 Tax=Micromonospora purpureochromogenes TaxID=47872 RepID=A0ABX2RKV5_9ACTN|nr:hypothetical protein [Micromonospora purpureochromogenes]NYF56740.1 hypothetical protein [Micromonospora purpureochromogenes]